MVILLGAILGNVAAVLVMHGYYGSAAGLLAIVFGYFSLRPVYLWLP